MYKKGTKTISSTSLSFVGGFHQYTITGGCGMAPHRLFSVGFVSALRFLPTAIRQMVKQTRLIKARMNRMRVCQEMEIKRYKSKIGLDGALMAFSIDTHTRICDTVLQCSAMIM